MTEQPPPTEPDGAADTQMFRKFVERDDEPPPKAVGVPFRVITLLIGLVVLAGLMYLFFQL